MLVCVCVCLVSSLVGAWLHLNKPYVRSVDVVLCPVSSIIRSYEESSNNPSVGRIALELVASVLRLCLTESKFIVIDRLVLELVHQCCAYV